MNVLWLFVVACCVGDGVAQVVVSFLDTANIVEEGDQFVVRLQITGTLTEDLVAIVSIQSDIGNDFIGATQVAKFTKDGSDTVNVTFTVRDDDEAEGDEVFTLYMVLAGTLAASIGQPSESKVRILANDDAFGIFGFSVVSPVEVRELTYTSIVELKISRTKGKFGDVSLSFMVNSSKPDSVEEDLFPGSGVIRFLNGEVESILQLQIKADNIPENAEQFTVMLTDSSPTAKIERSEIDLIILPNDSPIRFSNSVYRFEEGPGTQTVSIPVYRGKAEDDKSQIGSLAGNVVVMYTFTSRSAQNGLDFTAYNGQLLFQTGETTKMITFDIHDDDLPEMEESFIIAFTQITGDAVWVMPNSATIIISANDNPNGVITFRTKDFPSGTSLVQVNEDTFSLAVFPVARNGGTFGDITVEWEIVRYNSSSDPVTLDVGPKKGSIIFRDGTNRQDISITIVQDNEPETAEKFIVRLLSATAKASLEGITEAVLLIEDSDSVYGLVEFSSYQNHKIITSTEPRSLRLQLSRQGGRTANLIVNMTVDYVTNLGVHDPESVLDESEVVVVMNENEDTVMANVPLLSSAFLHIGGYFQATLTSVVLETEHDYGSYNTPKLNTRTQVTVAVSASEANGEIGFYNVTDIIVDEPETGILQVPLKIFREGYSGTAYVKWVLTGSGSSASMVTIDDVMYLSGTVTLSSGLSEIDLVIYVKADDIPELDEVMTVTLVSISPSNTQRLRPSATEFNITVRANDNPAGIFQFKSTMKDHYAIKENSESFTVTVERTGGNLVMKEVQYNVVPDGDKEFYGGTNVLRFEPGVSMLSATLLARGDGIPELDEDYTLMLVSFGEDPAAIGNKRNITITVLANDDPYGIIQFRTDPTIVYLDESTDSKTHTQDLIVDRSRGTFGTVSVIWTLSQGAGEDLTPTTGMLTFAEGVSSQAITLQSKKDDIPEIDERYKVQLSPPFGGARSGYPVIATVIIKENDNPIEFTKNLIYAHEPDTIQLTIIRRGMLYKPAVVHYRTLDGSASYLTGDYQEIIDTQINFAGGEETKKISISVLDDLIPEGNETFSIQLFDTGGNFIFTNNSKVTVVILSNDDAYGVFHFADPLQREAEEGNTVYFDIVRDRGTYGEIDLSWEIHDYLTNQLVPDGTEFANSRGTVRFKPQEGKYPLAIRPLPDNIPESDKTYKIVLTAIQVVVGRTDVILGRLDSSKTEASLLVKASDEPYGRFAFPPSSREISIAEDYLPGQESSTHATFTVERWQGSIGKVEVMWDTFSRRMGGNPPRLIDLIFVGIRPTSLTEIPSKRRPSTGTNVYFFTGSQGDYVTIPSEYQPSANNIRTGFSLSAWVQPLLSSNGYIIAKTNGGSYHSYSLRLTTTAISTQLHLTFSTAEQENHIIPISVNKNIQDGGWHHILISVVNATVKAYLDGTGIFTGNLVGDYVEDVAGKLLVGANALGTERFTGYMQDVRIFLRSLEMKEVEELHQTPAKEDIIPTSGILVYQQGDKMQTFSIRSLPDIEEEGNEVFSIGIVSVSNGASISDADSAAALTVLKSDNANGLFGFQAPCTPARTSNEDEKITCIVTRRRGDDDTVRVTWVVQKLSTTGYEPATQDFVEYTGKLVFGPGERTKTLQFQIKDDDIPELAETFRILLASAMSDDGVTGTTNTSGASIDPFAQESRLLIEDTDYPHGLLQFSDASTPPKQSDPMIKPAEKPVTIRVSEEDGIASLLVVRAQGLLGQVSVEWRTEDGTAKSGGKIPPDYVGAASSLVLAEDQRYAFINITLINNNIPEPDKTFSIQLSNPRFGAAVGVGSRATVTIDASDGAYGIYQFADSALNTTAKETGDVGYTPAMIEVVRLGGTIGQAQVTWQVIGDDGNDVVNATGNIIFSAGQTSGQAEIRIRGDTEPELDEIVYVVLTATTEGELGPTSKLTATVMIEANDDPYGIFVIPNTQRPVTVEESNADTTITVQRLYGRYGTVDVAYDTLKPDRTYDFLPGPVKWANSTTDFKPARGTIRFLPNQQYVSFHVTILDDVEPEQAESIFISLTGVNLIKGSQPRPVTGSPRLGFASENYAQIIIVMNDDASGVIELSSPNIETEESNPVLNLRVIRKGGAFGEVTVVFRTIDTTGQAQNLLDYMVTSTEVILSDGETSKQLPIQIIDDRIPELRETFVVELLDQIVGGATLGANRIATVTILPSDDPNGAFEFATRDMSVEEPENNQPYYVNITVVRTGGSLGVVTVKWEARLNGELANADIRPTSGSLHFVSNEGSRRITVAILPDDIPEGEENIQFVLTAVDNGGRIGTKNKFVLSIAPNDNPHGLLSLARSTFTVQETPGNKPQFIQVIRLGGTYGKLRMYYSTNQISLSSLATENGGTALGYYEKAIQDRKSRKAGTIVDVSSSKNKPESCAAECLNSVTCRSFVLTNYVNGMTCTLLSETFSLDDLEVDTNSQYHAKDMKKVSNLEIGRATSGQDFESVSEGSFLINDGATNGSVPLVILDDTTPEVDEKFVVILKRVIVEDPAIATSQQPQLGDMVSATVVIASNDNANGMFRIISNSPSASGNLVLVEEKNQLAVDLVVERIGGTIGAVSVDWDVSSTQGATYGIDFIADGATLTFAAGQSRRVISVTVLDDSEPEDNETMTIQLSNPQGGATLGPSSSLTIVILENDNVAGVLSFESTSYVANEGDKISIRVMRTAPAHGQVTVEWRIKGVGGRDPSKGFREDSGMFIFYPGELLKVIKVDVLSDDTPEVNEEYQIHLENITTSGVGGTGAAVINSQKGTALITIGSSNDPHGVIQFAVASKSIRVEENVGRVNLQIDRKFGAIGTVRVSYIMIQGSVTPISKDILQEALPNSDFAVNNGHVDLKDGQSSGAISVDIVNDDLPEIDEVFLVRLTKVELIGPGDKTLPPRLASSGATAEIIIGANDGAKGIFVFGSDSRRVTVNEMDITISLSVIREGGLFGNVSVFYYAQSITEGATLGTDYTVVPKELLFAAGERQKNIVVGIVDDNIPEPDETFEIILTNPRDGAELGTQSKAQITISANDNAGGFVSFDSREKITLYEPNEGDNSRSKVMLTVTRGPGVYGVATVQFVISANDGQPVTDLSPSTGTVTIGDGQSSGVAEITVVDDDIPEETETFSVQLQQPTGCLLGSIKQRVISIAPNDSPQGMFEIFVTNSRNSTISVEESVGLIKFDVVRSMGSSKKVSIDVTMVAESVPVSPGKKELTLADLQKLPGKKVSRWHSMIVNGVTYLLMLTSLPVGTALKSVDSSVLKENGQSLLLRWQGDITQIQTVTTNGASAADSFSIGDTQYVAVANGGAEGSRNVDSVLFTMETSGMLKQKQSFNTKGASDVKFFSQNIQKFLVFANSLDDNSKSELPLDIYIWEAASSQFGSSPWQRITSLYPRAVSVFRIGDVLFMAVANYYDWKSSAYETSSIIYKMESNYFFSLHQRISTQGAIDVKHLKIGDLDLVVYANNRQNVISSPQSSKIFRWDKTTQLFLLYQEIETNRIQSVSSFTDSGGIVYLVFANGVGKSEMFEWNVEQKRFKSVWKGDSAIQLHPFTIKQTSGALSLLAAADINPNRNPIVYQVAKVSRENTFMPRTITLTFDPDQMLLHASAFVLQDEIPEDTQTFKVALTNPADGAEIGPHGSVTVSVLSNDNAHGIIGFAPDSVNVLAEENVGRDNTIQLNVVRKQGYFGRVVVSWVASGDHDGFNDITPLKGKVEFASGQSVSTISLTIRDDDVAEFAEVTFIQLVEVLEKGTNLPGRGAIIGANSASKVTVMANDSPHGVVSWETALTSTIEPTGTDLPVTLHIVREQGDEGQLQISFVTSQAARLPPHQQATSGEDYVSRQGTVIMENRVTRTPVEIVIKHDDIPEATESFFVNITDVEVTGKTGNNGARPSVRIPGNVAEIRIEENDNARGLVQFNVTTNIEGRVDTYEQYGSNQTIHLPISRSIGLFGSITVTWQAEPIEATVLDFYPSSGTVTMATGQTEAEIAITIIDDKIPETMETFEVKLISVNGGATLGKFSSVRVAILKNDSPTGLFQFKTAKVVTKESLTANDPEGRATLTVERIQGSQGLVHVQWRLNAEAVDDFLEPLGGTLEFIQGRLEQPITVQTKPDTILEGQETFTVSLTSADNNADISPSRRDATVVILPNLGASGLISVVNESRIVYIGEPGESAPSYKGEAEIVLTRGEGIFGDISVTWSITPHEQQAFLQLEGTVRFVDLQQKASIIIASKDDTIPERRKTYTLQINSAAGGAKVSPDSAATKTNIVFVASDFPHGRFEFGGSQTITTSEDSSVVKVEVVRRDGNSGQVRVQYTTTSGTAVANEDFFETAGTLTFENGVAKQNIEVTIRPDDIPEGPEYFFVNLTSVELIYPLNNDYTKRNGLQLDMRPALGSVDAKTVVIEMNDNAAGTIEFEEKAKQFIVKEEEGMARVPVIRRGGNFGQVGVKFSIKAITASENDFIGASGELILPDGKRSETINVTIKDDTEMEFAETFQITLLETTGGALLGNSRLSIVTIAKSDFPNGQFGFLGQLDLVMANPENPTTQMFAIQRTGGLLGQQTVYWRIMGPNNPKLVLEDTSDISYNKNGVEVTTGSLVWMDSEAGQKEFVINVKPYSSWEIEKTFTLEIFRIEGNPLNAEAGEVSLKRGKVSLKIQKFGDPNGIIQFSLAAQTLREVEEPSTGTLDLIFPITRKAGTGIVGVIQIFWEVQGPTGTTPDVQPRNGSVFLADEQRSGQITLKILADDVSELTEKFTLAMMRVEGGAELDTEYRNSVFKIRYNDNPHGLYGVVSADQKVTVNSADLSRRIRLNFTRHAGTFGSTILTFTINYNKPQSGIILSENTGTVTFNEGSKNSIKMVDIKGDGFLELGSTFTVSLQDVQYLGNGMTYPPRLKAGETEAQISVPSLAANSKVGFKDTIISVNEDTKMVTLNIIRLGTYGSINVDWMAGVADADLPSGVTNGIITPTSGTINIPHGTETKQFAVQVNPKSNHREKFTIRLPGPPKTSVNGGTQLLKDQKEANIEPYGLVQFATASLRPTVSELEGRILLTVVRLYGSDSKLEIKYKTEADTAQADFDYKDIKTGLLSMSAGQTTATITVQIFQDNQPETIEMFKVKLLSVEKFPTSAQPGVSPRLSSKFAVSTVSIKESNDPYGILSIEPTELSVPEQYMQVSLKVIRTGGPYGVVSVKVRTVGGGESWTSTIVPNKGTSSKDTITDILGQRDRLNIATGGRDYEVLDTTITFQPEENEKQVALTILDDNIPEPAMSVIVYLTEPLGGARIAAGTPDAGKKGFSVVTIQPSDVSNGVIGFSDDSRKITANEDVSPVITLTLNRLSAYFGNVQVFWKAKKTMNSSDNEDLELSSQLVATSGVTTCPAQQSRCSLPVKLINDETPEEAWSFVVKLIRAEEDAELNKNSLYATISVEASDYIRGLIEFTKDTRMNIIGENAKSVRLMVERTKGQGYDIEVSYNTLQITSQTSDAGVKIYPALDGADFTGQTGTLVFKQHRQEVEFIDLTLTPVLASNNPLPKQFSVLLKSPSNGASLHPDFAKAYVRIVKEEKIALWKAIVEQQTVPLTNANIRRTLDRLDVIAKDELDDGEVTLIEDTLKKITNEGKTRKLPSEVIASTVNLFCKLLDPSKNDATKGRHSLVTYLEEFAYTFLTGVDCPNPNPPNMITHQCTHIMVSAGRWPMANIESFNYPAQRQDKLVLPTTIPPTSSSDAKGCHDFHMIEYNSDQWFQSGDDNQLLSGRVISFGIKGRQSGYIDTPVTFRIHSPDRRVATRRAQCVYFDMGIKKWVGPDDICHVSNNLDLGTDDYVDCSCKHMTSYAVVAKTYEAGLVGYTLWFFIACFVCIGCMFLTVLSHHACSTQPTISACLIMHMCFAAMATQICLVVAAYLSPSEILVYNPSHDNYRCIVMGIFMHYFFLTQFTWIVTQSINFWKLLVMNDEHTDRKYVFFFILGWGLPLLLVAVFYAIVYNVYKFVYNMPVGFIYGDVNNNSEMCFITNPYVALGGIIIPVLLMLMVPGVIFVKAFQILAGWQAYDDIYRSRYNFNEVRLILLFWLVIVLTWLWGGLHMVYGQLWMLILFCLFNILQGLLALILYGIIRNPMLACLFGPQRASYAVSSDFDNFFPTTSNNFHFQPSPESAETPKGSRASLLNESWERDSIGHNSQMTVKRALPSQVYINPPVAFITPPSQNDVDDRDFDELLYALKAGGSFAPSELSHSNEDDNLSELSVRLEGFKTKRIDITDTHL